MTPSFPTRRSSDLVIVLAGFDESPVFTNLGANDFVLLLVAFRERLHRSVRIAAGNKVQLVQRIARARRRRRAVHANRNRRSEEHTSELQSLMRISYAVFCLKKKKQQKHNNP